MRRPAIFRNFRELVPFLAVWFLLLVVFEVLGVVGARSAASARDFRSFYAAGYLLRTHPANLYNVAQQTWVENHVICPGLTGPFFSPAYEALLFAPFSLMTYKWAYLCFLAFNLVLLLASFLVARDAFSAEMPLWQPKPGLMLLVFFPVLIALFHGQMSPLLLFVCCATWSALKRGRVGLAGLILAVGVCKFNLIVPIALILAVRWGWRFIAGFVSGSAIAMGLSALLVGGRGMAMMTGLLRSGSLATNQGAAAQGATAVFPMRMSSLYSLVYVVTHGLQLPGLTFGLTMAFSALVVLVCAWIARGERRDEVAFSAAVLCGLLVSYHMYVHDLALLLLPLALLKGIRHHEKLMLVSFALPVVLAFSMGWDSFFLIAPVLLWAVWLVARSQKRVAEASVCVVGAAA